MPHTQKRRKLIRMLSSCALLLPQIGNDGFIAILQSQRVYDEDENCSNIDDGVTDTRCLGTLISCAKQVCLHLCFLFCGKTKSRQKDICVRHSEMVFLSSVTCR